MTLFTYRLEKRSKGKKLGWQQLVFRVQQTFVLLFRPVSRIFVDSKIFYVLHVRIGRIAGVSCVFRISYVLALLNIHIAISNVWVSFKAWLGGRLFVCLDITCAAAIRKNAYFKSLGSFMNMA